MTIIELRFPAHRYHGTPWGRHVNEGVAEWPPSPYRFYRAMYDVWQRKCPHIDREQICALLQALAAAPPRFRMPQVTLSHTRSYLSRNTGVPTEKTLIFDGFVALPEGAACAMEWDADLPAPQKGLLATLLANLNYLGRSESWVSARLVDEGPDLPYHCAPLEQSTWLGEPVTLACVVPPREYSPDKSGPDWLAALCYSTTDVTEKKLSGPPLLRQVDYTRQAGAVAAWLPSARPRPAAVALAVKLALHDRVLPLAVDSVPLAESLRRAIMSRAGRAGAISDTVSGKDSAGVPLDGHRHLFILPQANSAGRIHEVLLFSKNGLCASDLHAIREMRQLYRADRDPIRVVVAFEGASDDPRFRVPVRKASSVTPFATVRHWRKGRGSLDQFLESEVRRECKYHGLPEPEAVRRVEKPVGLFHALEFRRNRYEEKPVAAYAFQLEFAQPVLAPFSLGYCCHFGLGQFAAVES